VTPVRVAIVVAAALAAGGCNLSLFAKSVPPPGRAGTLSEVKGFWGLKYYRADVSVGVALGVGCDKQGPCRDMVVRSSDRSIVEVTPAAISRLESVGIAGVEARPPAAFVLVGKKPGTAQIVVTSHDGGNRRIEVTVLPSPSPLSTRATVAGSENGAGQ
jgi:hypothetical protein